MSCSPISGFRRRVAIVLLTAASLLALAAGLFWHQDLRYSLPTPRPQGLLQPPIGSPAPPGYESRPTLLHFFNPSCPCSRFNLEHVTDLAGRYRDRVNFVAILSGDGTPAQLLRVYERLNLGFPGRVDDGSLAASAGVYATPQAVLLKDGKLYYRGNYNASRYCRDPRTEFARLAIERLLSGQPPPAEARAAASAYGCPLRKPGGGRNGSL